MNKYEIETAILKEFEAFLPAIENMPFDKGLILMRKEAWRLADKYDTDGANVFAIVFKRFGEIKHLSQFPLFRFVIIMPQCFFVKLFGADYAAGIAFQII